MDWPNLTWQEMKALEGKRVRVLLDNDPEEVFHEGVLVSLREDGEAAIRNDDGRIGYSWPALDMQVAP